MIPVDQLEPQIRQAAQSGTMPQFNRPEWSLAVQTTVPGSLPPFFKGQLAWLESQGLRVHTVSAPGPELRWVSEAEQVRPHAVPMSRSFSPLQDVLALWRLVRLYRRCRFTMVHAFTPKGGFLGMLAATIARCPVRLFTIWGLAPEAGTLRVRLMLLADKLSCALADKVVVECPSIAELAVTKRLCTREKLVVTPAWSTCSLDLCLTDLGDLPESRATTRRQWGLPTDALVIGFVGRVVRDKGVHELVDAFDTLAPEFPRLHLLIVGARETEDAVAPEVLRQIDQHPHIHCTGFQEDVRPLLGAMDLLVHPSYREGLPAAPLEAAARGLPVVATRIPGCVDAVQDGVSGFLIAPRNSRELAAAIRQYLLDPELRRRHGEKGRALILERYDRRTAWATLLDLYRQCLAECQQSSHSPPKSPR